MTKLTGSKLNTAVAERIFGWRWKRKHGVPVKGTPGYPDQQPVRIFVPPGHDDMPDADGTEPLAYCYCSSSGYQVPPDYSGRDDILVLRWARETWADDSLKWHLFKRALGDATDYEPGDYSRAALSALEDAACRPGG